MIHRLNWLLIGFLLPESILLCHQVGLGWDRTELIYPLSCTAVVVSFGLFYKLYRPVPKFSKTLFTVAQLVLYSTGFVYAMYAATTFGRPLVDDYLIAFDRAVGVTVPHVLKAVYRIPGLDGWLFLAYMSLIPQTILVIVVLGFGNKLKELDDFVFRFVFGSMILLPIYILLPAAGPAFTIPDYPLNPELVRYVQHFEGLRSGEINTVSLQTATGMISFPSFHTAWALLLAMSLAHNRLLRVPGLLLNAVVIIATVMHGAHYIAELASGAAVVCIIILPTHAYVRRISDLAEEQVGAEARSSRAMATA